MQRKWWWIGGGCILALSAFFAARGTPYGLKVLRSNPNITVIFREKELRRPLIDLNLPLAGRVVWPKHSYAPGSPASFFDSESGAAGILRFKAGQTFDGGSWEIDGQTFPVWPAADLPLAPDQLIAPMVYGRRAKKAILKDLDGKTLVELELPPSGDPAPKLKDADVQVFGKTVHFHPRPLVSPMFLPPIEVRVKNGAPNEMFGIAYEQAGDDYQGLVLCNGEQGVIRLNIWTGPTAELSIGPVPDIRTTLTVSRKTPATGKQQVRVTLPDGFLVIDATFEGGIPHQMVARAMDGKQHIIAPEDIDLGLEQTANFDQWLDPHLRVLPFSRAVQNLRDGQKIPARLVRRDHNPVKIKIDLGLPAPNSIGSKWYH